jgi:hypothetical protein
MQLAVYLGSAFLVLVAIVVILRVIVRHDYLQRGRLTPISSASEWLLGIIWASFSYFYLPTDWLMIHVGKVLRRAGWVLITLGVLTMILSLSSLGLRPADGTVNPSALKQPRLAIHPPHRQPEVL